MHLHDIGSNFVTMSNTFFHQNHLSMIPSSICNILVLLCITFTLILIRKNRDQKLKATNNFTMCNLREKKFHQEIEKLKTKINELQNENKQIIEKAETYRLIMDSSQDAFTVIENKTIIDCNAKLLTLFQIKRVDFVNQPIDLLYQMLYEDNSENKICLDEILHKALNGYPQQFEWTFKKINGPLFFADVHISRVFVQDNFVVLMSIHDITEKKKSLEALMESEERLRSFIDQSVEGITMVDQNCITIEWNTACETITGIPKKEAIGIPYWDNMFRLLPKINQTQDFLFEIKSKMQNAMKSGIPTFEMPRIAKIISIDGKERITIQRIFPVRKSSGFWFCSIVQDITELEKSRQKIALSDSRNQALLQINQMLEKSANEIAQYAINECVNLTKSQIGYIAFADETKNKMTIQACAYKNFCPPSENNLPLEIDFQDESILLGAIKKKKPIIINDYINYRTGNPKYPLWHNPIKNFLNVPILSGKNVVLSVGVGNKEENYDENDIVQIKLLMEGMWRIIEQKNTFDALTESENRFRNMAENIEEMFILLDAIEKKTLYISPAAKQIIGIDSQEILNHHNAIDKILLNGFDLPINKALIWSEAISHEFSISYNGNVKWLKFKSFPIRNEMNQIYRIAGVISDITPFKTAQQEILTRQQQLIQADKLSSLGLLVSGTAHEINNPNNLIMLSTDLLKALWNQLLSVKPKSNCSTCKYQESLDKIVPKMATSYENIINGSKRIAAIVKNLKDFVRMESTSQNDYKWVDIKSIIDASVMITSFALNKATRNFTVSIEQSLPQIKVNPQRIEQVIVNLLLNACASLASSEKSIKLEACSLRQENLISIKISDEGCGIHAEELGKIFDPFYTTKREQGGTGLGLSVSYSIIREHNGLLKAESDFGKGTTMTILLPITNPLE